MPPPAAFAITLMLLPRHADTLMPDTPSFYFSRRHASLAIFVICLRLCRRYAITTLLDIIFHITL